MGAAVTLELSKPLDAGDIRDSGSLVVAREEIIRLRSSLGHLAQRAGFDAVDLTARDLIFEEDENEDFERCVREIAHVRRALKMNTLESNRRTRGNDDLRYERKRIDHSAASESDDDNSSDDEAK